MARPGGRRQQRLAPAAARALRAFADGYVAVLLPAYLLALGFGPWEVGVLATATLLGSACATLAVGAWGHRVHHQRLIAGAAVLMAATGFAFGVASSFWPLLLIAFIGTLNPSSGDVSVFLPLEHARLAEAAEGDARTALFARYTCWDPCARRWARWRRRGRPIRRATACRRWTACAHVRAVWRGGMRRVAAVPPPAARRTRPARRRACRSGRRGRTVVRLAALFCVDSFAGGWWSMR